MRCSPSRHPLKDDGMQSCRSLRLPGGRSGGLRHAEHVGSGEHHLMVVLGMRDGDPTSSSSSFASRVSPHGSHSILIILESSSVGDARTGARPGGAFETNH